MRADSDLTEMQAEGEEEQMRNIMRSLDEMGGPLRDYTDWILDGWKAERPDLNVSPVAIINQSTLTVCFRRLSECVPA